VETEGRHEMRGSLDHSTEQGCGIDRTARGGRATTARWGAGCAWPAASGVRCSPTEAWSKLIGTTTSVSNAIGPKATGSAHAASVPRPLIRPLPIRARSLEGRGRPGGPVGGHRRPPPPGADCRAACSGRRRSNARGDGAGIVAPRTAWRMSRPEVAQKGSRPVQTGRTAPGGRERLDLGGRRVVPSCEVEFFADFPREAHGATTWTRWPNCRMKLRSQTSSHSPVPARENRPGARWCAGSCGTAARR